MNANIDTQQMTCIRDNILFMVLFANNTGCALVYKFTFMYTFFVNLLLCVFMFGGLNASIVYIILVECFVRIYAFYAAYSFNNAAVVVRQ